MSCLWWALFLSLPTSFAPIRNSIKPHCRAVIFDFSICFGLWSPLSGGRVVVFSSFSPVVRKGGHSFVLSGQSYSLGVCWVEVLAVQTTLTFNPHNHAVTDRTGLNLSFSFVKSCHRDDVSYTSTQIATKAHHSLGHSLSRKTKLCQCGWKLNPSIRWLATLCLALFTYKVQYLQTRERIQHVCWVWLDPEASQFWCHTLGYYKNYALKYILKRQSLSK